MRPPERVWAMLLDPETLQAVIPGCHSVEKISDTHFRADVTLGIGPVKGRYRAEVNLSELDPPRAVTLARLGRRRARLRQRRGAHHADADAEGGGTAIPTSMRRRSAARSRASAAACSMARRA